MEIVEISNILHLDVKMNKNHVWKVERDRCRDIDIRIKTHEVRLRIRIAWQIFISGRLAQH